VKTPAKKNTLKVPATPQQPVNTFTHVIEVAPSSLRFGGWGPKVLGPSGILTRWN
jgi:hypothetical protein